MFYYVKGIVAHVAPYLAVIDCGGVGYACKTTNSSLADLTVGQEGKLYTYLHVREDLFELYGFSTENERNCFQMLIGVSGVGPKAALSILSSTTPEQLALSIITGDEKALTCAPGIGKKIAQRVILELKDQLSKGQLGAGESIAMDRVMPGAPASKMGEANAALAVLGYSQAEINLALRDIDMDTLPIEAVIKLALKKMMK